MAGRQGRRRFGAIRRLPSGRYQVRYRTVDGRDVTAPMTSGPRRTLAATCQGLRSIYS
jgi:hypothetical protein